MHMASTQKIKSASALGLATISSELNLPPQEYVRQEHPVDLDAVNDAASLKLPEYVKHQEGATRAGMLSAQAIVMEYEAAAKEFEKLGDELRAAQQRVEQQQEVFANALRDLQATAKAYREEAARVFKEVESVTTKASEASTVCAELRNRIAGAVIEG
jgi:predicted  nucleic acid-binding Zn-ribbon protein